MNSPSITAFPLVPLELFLKAAEENPHAEKLVVQQHGEHVVVDVPNSPFCGHLFQWGSGNDQNSETVRAFEVALLKKYPDKTNLLQRVLPSKEAAVAITQGLSAHKIQEVIKRAEGRDIADPAIREKSSEIQNWAQDQAKAKKQTLEEVTGALEYFSKDPEKNKTQIALLKKHLFIIKGQKAENYAVWTQLRHQLIQGNKNTAASLKEKGCSINADWTVEELNEDWAHAKEDLSAITKSANEPIRTLISEWKQKKEEVKAAKQKILSLAADTNIVFQQRQEEPVREMPLPTQELTDLTHSVPQTTSNNLDRPWKKLSFDEDSSLSDIADDYARHPLNPDGTTNEKIVYDMHGGIMYDRSTPPPREDVCTIS